MRRNSAGSLMLEYAIYSGIVSLLALVAVHCVCLMQRNIRVFQAQQQIALQAITLVNVLTHDIWQALPEGWASHQMQDNMVIWPCRDHDVGWMVKGTDLFRILGTYDSAQRRWHKAHRSLIARNVTSFAIRDLSERSLSPVAEGVNCAVTFQNALVKKEVLWMVAFRAVPC